VKRKIYDTTTGRISSDNGVEKCNKRETICFLKTISFLKLKTKKGRF
jgi:hypothetical protein